MPQYDVIVSAARALTPAIRELVLKAKDGTALPSYGPGAHIEVGVTLADGKQAARPYSLLGGTVTGDDPPDTYRIAIERREDGAGGSKYLGDLPIGSSLGISAPRNDFALETHPANRLLVAGGIGIVPIFAMARRLKREGRAFTLAYVARDLDQMAYRDEVAALAGGNVILHEESSEARPLDVKPLAKKLAYPAEVYVCGSYALNKAVTAAAGAAGLSKLQIHEQCFAPPPLVLPENSAFSVSLKRSGLDFEVPADASILETMMMAGHTPKFYCGRGECGICPMTVVSADGPIEHRDHTLKPDERGSRICICVSRIKGGKLVLDA
ncbi:MAG TPA: PDR/VanB family oxidoreductase [Stellaceae bacterium]|jgi:vanillate O-demethylase ferredoxin subunit|nr:PDR/VanB family oxidoreductase [Stellaceae bacterium]